MNLHQHPNTANLTCSYLAAVSNMETLGAVGTVHSAVDAPARPPHVTLYKINLFETHKIILTFTIEPLFPQ